jgi:hypothetical protein
MSDIKTMQAEIEAHLRAGLEREGFKRRSAFFVKEIAPGVLGKVYFGITSRPAAGYLWFNPHVSVRHQHLLGVRQLLTGNADDGIIRSVIRAGVEMLVANPTEANMPWWSLDAGDPTEAPAAEMLSAYLERGVPWMNSHATLESIVEAMQGGEAGLERRYDEPVALWMVGRTDESREVLATELKKRRPRPNGIADDYAQFAERLMEAMERPFAETEYARPEWVAARVKELMRKEKDAKAAKPKAPKLPPGTLTALKRTVDLGFREVLNELGYKRRGGWGWIALGPGTAGLVYGNSLTVRETGRVQLDLMASVNHLPLERIAFAVSQLKEPPTEWGPRGASNLLYRKDVTNYATLSIFLPHRREGEQWKPWAFDPAEPIAAVMGEVRRCIVDEVMPWQRSLGTLEAVIAELQHRFQAQARGEDDREFKIPIGYWMMGRVGEAKEALEASRVWLADKEGGVVERMRTRVPVIESLLAQRYEDTEFGQPGYGSK